jgi:hypothetical protein
MKSAFLLAIHLVPLFSEISRALESTRLLEMGSSILRLVHLNDLSMVAQKTLMMVQ